MPQSSIPSPSGIALKLCITCSCSLVRDLAGSNGLVNATPVGMVRR